MRSTRLLPLLATLILTIAVTAPALADGHDGDTRLLRYPSIHRDTVVFVYAGDIWRAPSGGGEARRLTSHAGDELTPKISPDGKSVAYSAEYGGSRQVWVIPIEGGTPRQLTFYNDVGAMPPRGGFDYWIQGWRADGTILVRMNRTPWGQRPGRYFTVDPAGGLEKPLPVPVGGSASFSPDGRSLAYTYFDREFRTWKRYRGGRNQDIWLLDLERMRSTHLVDDAASDNFPMWHGSTVYFTSDRDHTLNLFAVDTTTKTVRKLTSYDDYDVLWPSLGPESIVFMHGGRIHRLDLGDGSVRTIPITIGDDLPGRIPRWEDVSDNIADADVAPGGERAVFEARGDLFTVPAEHGPTRNLTRTQGVREAAPAWSPDGATIAYWSDATGEMELFLRAQDGSGEPRRLTRGGAAWRNGAAWSPDSNWLAFGDSDRKLNVVDADSGAITEVDTGTQGSIFTYRWSPDSRWLVYETNHPDTELPTLAVWSLETKRRELLGDGLNFDTSPAFSADGAYLFFLSTRDYNLEFSSFEFNYVYDDATRVYAAALTPDAPPLFPLRSDEVSVAQGDDEKDGKAKKDEGDDNGDGPPKVEIVADGFVARTVALPGVGPGQYAGVNAVDGAVLYRRFTDGEPPTLMRYDLGKREEQEVSGGVRAYAVAADGKKALFATGGGWAISSLDPGATPTELDLSGLRMKLDPVAEWRQMFDETWRIGRDWFYDPAMHGIDWAAIGERYRALLPHVAHRSDLDFIFGELISELEAGHAYVQSGETESVERVEGGMLGAELEAGDRERYRIAKIFPGENWHDDWRSPLTEPGVDVDEGDYILAIDGEPLTTADNPYRLLEGKGGAQVTLRVNDRPREDGAREVTVRTVTSEGNLRYLDWLLGRMALVDELSDGTIGYIHLPNTAVAGNRMLQKLFYSQSAKPALIVDDRYNGGGFIPDRMIEMLSRTTLSYWARRGIAPMTTPGFRHDGPKAMLINGYAASGGDALPFYFRKVGLGKLIGTRTWGGLIGITGGPTLVDGGGALYPTFRFYSTDGEWEVENEGVAPDIEVWDVPEAIAAGGDPSIEKAVEVLLEELKSYEGPPREPSPPRMESGAMR